MVDTERRAPATASINSAHAHLGDKLSELYHILWRNVDSVRTTVQRGRVREVLRALRGIEAHRRVKVVPANFIGRWANSGSQTTISFISPFFVQRETGNVVLLFLNVDFPSSLPILRFFVKMIGIEKYFNIFYTTQHCFASNILYSSTYYSYSYTPILIFKKVRLGLQISIDNKKKESKMVGIFFSPSLDESREERVEVIRQDK